MYIMVLPTLVSSQDSLQSAAVKAYSQVQSSDVNNQVGAKLALAAWKADSVSKFSGLPYEADSAPLDGINVDNSYFLNTQGAALMSEFQSGTNAGNASQNTSIGSGNSQGFGATITATTFVEPDSAAIDDAQILITSTDPVRDVDIESLEDDAYLIKLVDGPRYRATRIANSDEANIEGSNTLSLVEEAAYNAQILNLPGQFTRDSTSNLPVQSTTYSANRRISYLSDTVANGSVMDYTIAVNSEDVQLNTAYRAMTAYPNSTGSAGVSSLSSTPVVVTSSVATSSLPIKSITDPYPTNSFVNLPSSQTMAEFLANVQSYWPEIDGEYQFTIESDTVNQGEYALSESDSAARGVGDDVITGLDDSNLLDNYPYMYNLMEPGITHTFTYANGSLTKEGLGLNTASFDLTTGPESLTSAQWHASGTTGPAYVPNVTFYETSMSNNASTSSTSRRADVSTLVGTPNKIGTVNVAYAGDVSLAANLQGDAISQTVRQAEVVSYTLESLLASTDNDVVSTNYPTDAKTSGDSILIKRGEDNSSISYSDLTYSSTYAFPNDKVSILDITAGEIYNQSSEIYHNNAGTKTVVAGVASNVTVSNATLDVADKRDIELRIAAKGIEDFTNFPSSQGWSLVYSISGATCFRTDNKYEGILADKYVEILSKDPSTGVSIDFALNTPSTSYDYKSFHDELTATVTCGSITVTTITQNDELTESVTNVTHDTSVFNVIPVQGIPSNIQIREFTYVKRYRVSTQLLISNISNVLLRSPIMTKTILYKRAYDTVSGRYIPNSSSLLNGTSITWATGTLVPFTSGQTLNSTWNATVGEILPYKVYFVETANPANVVSETKPIELFAGITANINLSASAGLSGGSAVVNVSGATVMDKDLYQQDVDMVANSNYFHVLGKQYAFDNVAFANADFDIRTANLADLSDAQSMSLTLGVTATDNTSLGGQSTYTINIDGSSIQIGCATNVAQNLRIVSVPRGAYRVQRFLNNVLDYTTYPSEQGSGSSKYISVDEGVFVPTDSGAAEAQGNKMSYDLLSNRVSVTLFNGYADRYNSVGRIDVNELSTDSAISRQVVFVDKRGYNGSIVGSDVNNLVRTVSTMTLDVAGKGNTASQTWEMYVDTYNIDNLSNGNGDLGITFTVGRSMLEDQTTYTRTIDTVGDSVHVEVEAGSQGLNLNYIRNLKTPELFTNFDVYPTILAGKIRLDSSFSYSIEVPAAGLAIFKYEHSDIATVDVEGLADSAWVWVKFLSHDELRSENGATFGATSTSTDWLATKNFGAFVDAFFVVGMPLLKIEYFVSTGITTLPFNLTSYPSNAKTRYLDLPSLQQSSVTHTESDICHLTYTIPARTILAYVLDPNVAIKTWQIDGNKITVSEYYKNIAADIQAWIADNTLPFPAPDYTYIEDADIRENITSQEATIIRQSGANKSKWNLKLKQYPDGSEDPAHSQLNDLNIHIQLSSQFFEEKILLAVDAGDSVKLTLYAVESLSAVGTNQIKMVVAKYVSNELGGNKLSAFNQDLITVYRFHAATKYTLDCTKTIAAGNPSLISGINLETIIDELIDNVSAAPGFQQDNTFTPADLAFTLTHHNMIGASNITKLLMVTSDTRQKTVALDLRDLQRHQNGFAAPIYRITHSGHTITRQSHAQSLNLAPTPSSYSSHNPLTSLVADTISSFGSAV